MQRVVHIASVVLLLTSLGFCQTAKDTNRERRPYTDPIPNEATPRYTDTQIDSLTLIAIREWAQKPQVVSDPDAQAARDDDFYGFLAETANYAVRRESAEIGNAIVSFSVRSSGVRLAKAHALSVFGHAPTEAAIPFLVSCLDDASPEIRKEASQTLIIWGKEWDRAIQAIYNNNNYLILQYSRDPRAPEACRFGTLNGSFEGRMLAAWALQAFGDSATLIEVSKYILQNAPIDDGADNSLARAKYTAIQTLAKQGQVDDVGDIARLASDGSALVRIQAVDALGYAAFKGNLAAYDALTKIAESSPDAKLRGSARSHLERLEKPQQEGK